MHPAEPFYFGAAAQPMFGWYHPPEVAPRGAVVLCTPLGLDGTRAHWSYRHLAERLARAGHAVLRFDWRGTGDSAGDDYEPNRVATWVEDLHLAVEELKRRSGAAAVTLVGLRAGATLAGHVAAQRDDVGALVLWMPAQTGAAWVAEMAKLHKLYLRIVPQTEAPEPDGEELLGSFASNATIADLARIDLLAIARRPAPRALVVEEGPLRFGPELRDRLTTLGVEVEWRRGTGQKFLFTVPHKATLPDESTNTIVDWIAALPRNELPAATPATALGRSAPARSFVERPVRFGAEQRIFGILVPPAEPSPSERPAIVLLPAGAVNRCGPHRLYVTMARRWAALGFTVLRVDLSGIGDTPAPPGTTESLVYPRDGYADISAAIEFVTRETGSARVILAGLCSGADFTFQVARRQSGLAGAIMMNPRTFLELNLGRVEGPPVTAPEALAASREESLRVTAGFQQISERGVDALLIVSRPDPGIDFVDLHAPEEMSQAAQLPRFRRVDVPGTDHTFTTVSSQRQVLELTTSEFLARHR
jgi:alpha-beta hydrolase superfamily lysophospholipase